MGEKRSSLAKNTLMLYILTASNYLFGLATIPYLTRVLGAETYGLIGFATAFSYYVQLVLDFGFLLSATAAVANCHGEIEKISKIFTAVTICKLFLILASFGVVFVITLLVPQFSSDPLLYLGFTLYVSINCLIPDYVYRGMEQMTIVTIRTVLIKAVFLLGIIIFVKSSVDYLLVPFFYALGALFALVLVFPHMKNRLGVWFVRVNTSFVLATFKESASFFVSRVASTFYSSLNVLILGFISPGSSILGQFTACNNAVSAGRAISSPIADSMYPYMVRTKNYKLLIKTIIIGEAIMVPCCIVIGVFASGLCGIFFGEEYYEAGDLLRIMILLVPISLASYLLGFPGLTPLGKAQVANLSVVIGAFVQVGIFIVLGALNGLNAYSICIATVVTEMTVLLIRTAAFIVGLRGKNVPSSSTAK